MIRFFKKKPSQDSTGNLHSDKPALHTQSPTHNKQVKGRLKKAIPHLPEDHYKLDEDKKEIALTILNEDIEKYPPENIPFFIVGCVRSGTTLLRDLLRDHPRLECPEETHFFRWSDPYGSPRYKNQYRNKLFREHREIDGIDPTWFHYALMAGRSKEHMAFEYGKEYLKGIGRPDARLFDKTPQNVYGMFFINAVYPEARFIHIYRHPFNVITSLMEGKVMPKHSFQGALNYWVESMMLIEQFKRFMPELLLEIKYEDVCENPDPYLRELLEFVGEDPDALPSQSGKAHPEKNKYKERLTQEEMETIKFNCEPYFTQYGYEI